ncbi:MAG: glycosyltransferase family 4 protein [Candidatus Bathyarchaeia archaeon]
MRFRLAVFNTQPPHLFFGGVERRIIETAKRLKSRADITIYSGTKAGFTEPAFIDGISFLPFYSTDKVFPLDDWFFNRSVSKNVDGIMADVYEAHLSSGYGLLRALRRHGSGAPFIHVIHGVLADEYEQAKKSEHRSVREIVANLFMQKLAKMEEETAKNATAIVTVSRYSFEKIQEYYGVGSDKLHIVPNGVDTDKFKPAENTAELKRRFGLDNAQVVLFVGSLIPRKGLFFLVEAAKKVISQGINVKFVIVGDGPMKSQLLASISKWNLSGNFKFLGSISEDVLVAVYGCADVFVLPSIQEGQGIVLLEAQASGVPVVAFDVGGVKDVVRNGSTGFLVDCCDSSKLADALLRLLSDKPLRERLGMQGRKFVMENYTWDLCAQKMLDIYNKVLH